MQSSHSSKGNQERKLINFLKGKGFRKTKPSPPSPSLSAPKLPIAPPSAVQGDNLVKCFLDLPLEVILNAIGFIKDVHTIKAILSIDEVEHLLSQHVKIVLDFPRKQPEFFTFDGAYEVIRIPDLRDFTPKQFLYLVEIDMGQKSFHSGKFYPNSDGVYTELQKVLKGYSGPNVWLCLTIVNPLEGIPNDIQMLFPKETFVDIFKSLQFQSVHLRLPPGDYFPFGYTEVTPLEPFKYSMTFDIVVAPDADYFLSNSKTETPNQVPMFQHSTYSMLEFFLKMALSINSPFVISTELDPSLPELPTGNIFKNGRYTWSLGSVDWDNCKEMSISLLDLIEDCVIEMEHGPVETPVVTSFKDFKWDLKLQMSRSLDAKNGEVVHALPKITGLHSKSLSSLSIKSDNNFPLLSDISLPNLSALSLEFYPDDSSENIDAISLEASFISSPIEYLSVNNLILLTKCTFSTNLSHLEGITIKTSLELDEFNVLPFPHLKSLAITTETPGDVSANAPRLEQLNWISKSEVSWGLNFLEKFTKLKALDIKADEFKDAGRPTFPELLTIRIEYLPAKSELKGQEKGNIAEVSKWMPISAPKLEDLTFVYDPTRATDHAYLYLTSLPSLKKVTFGTLRWLKLRTVQN